MIKQPIVKGHVQYLFQLVLGKFNKNDWCSSNLFFITFYALLVFLNKNVIFFFILLLLSPMGDRCFFLHDNRVATLHDSWLLRSTGETLLSRVNKSKNNKKDEVTRSHPAVNVSSSWSSCNHTTSMISRHDHDATITGGSKIHHQQQQEQQGNGPCSRGKKKHRHGGHEDNSNIQENDTVLTKNSHVDWHSHSKLSHDNIGHPFGKNFLLSNNPKEASSPTFHEFYNAIINKYEKFDILSKHQALQIVRKMRHASPPISCYNYHDTHKLSNAQVCMLIQTRVFDLSSGDLEEIIPPATRMYTEDSMSSSSLFWENKIDEQDEAKNQYHNCGGRPIVIASEVMFEPSKEDDCEDVDIAIIFTSPHQHTSLLQKLTERELKRINKVKARMQSNEMSPELNIFQLCCPRDDEAYDLVTRVLDHACQSVVLEKFNCHFMIDSTYNHLADEFNALMNHFALFYWPVNENEKKEEVTQTLPNFDTMYNVYSSTNNGGIANLWKSFHENLANHDGDLLYNFCENNQQRLSVFLKLSSHHSCYHDTNR